MSDQANDPTETLNTLIASSALEWSDADMLALVSALRDQRERWNQEQSIGSRKRVTSKKTAAPKVKKDLAFAGLKL